ncbi:WG repeat-containing protein [Flavobacterium algicola]|uniref:WG repeat-containing protein n=1 Tax=Flavobacterium algicola TaxID=556529 RepID=UPI001EFC68D3|nr:WG repeat-containing protein [Flavobacterium algicola]MCG9791006.1 WG repeat-containing protein [Flavobacterium algicola]
MKNYFIAVILFMFAFANAQKKFKIYEEDILNYKSIYHIVNEKGEMVKELDSSKYIFSFNGNDYENFAIFSMRDESGWCAIDINEKLLFKVYNTSIGEPSPDGLIENKIRIVDDQNKIGFADSSGKIIIQPQFEMVTSFHKGKAIIGRNCEKIPWGNHEEEGGCHHFSISCEQQGYINEKGEILQIGDYSFEEIQKKIKWKELY